MLNSLFAQEQTQPVVEQGFTLTQPVATVLASSGVLLAALLAFVATWLGRRQTEKHFRLSNHRDRFTTVAGQLADPSAAVRIAGVYAMEALADDWLQYRWYTLPKKRKAGRHEAQTCINVLCSYLCLPYEPSGREQTHTKTVIRYAPSDRVVEEHHEHRTEDSQVRQGILRIIAAHLRPDARTSWSGFNFDFTGAYLENTNFADCVFRGGAVFTRARFHGAQTLFGEAQFHSPLTSFDETHFHSPLTSFDRAQFHNKSTSFDRAQFHSPWTSFDRAQFHGEQTRFAGAQFRSERTSFGGVQFKETWFAGAQFLGKQTFFSDAQFLSGWTSFDDAQFHGRLASFDRAQFHGGLTSFAGVQFRSGLTSFAGAQFLGGLTSFGAQFLSERTWFEEAQFRSTETSFGVAQFRSDKTSFAGAQFHRLVDFSVSQVWGNVVVDWQWPLPSGQVGPAPVQPASVLPVDWPPVVASPSETVGVR